MELAVELRDLAVAALGQWCGYELRTTFRLGGPIGEHRGFWGGPVKAYTTNLVQGSYGLGCRAMSAARSFFFSLGQLALRV